MRPGQFNGNRAMIHVIRNSCVYPVLTHENCLLYMYSCMTGNLFCAVGFRQAFCQVALQPDVDRDRPCLISRLMLHDARMFKGKQASAQSIKLTLINGL